MLPCSRPRVTPRAASRPHSLCVDPLFSVSRSSPGLAPLILEELAPFFAHSFYIRYLFPTRFHARDTPSLTNMTVFDALGQLGFKKLKCSASLSPQFRLIISPGLAVPSLLPPLLHHTSLFLFAAAFRSSILSVPNSPLTDASTHTGNGLYMLKQLITQHRYKDECSVSICTPVIFSESVCLSVYRQPVVFASIWSESTCSQ
ncbi:hypothetical protein BGW80DRAFT_857493 [Lactifluus volemus]|nr:hypothetical protein BGW80DRAFT_857493 [Lactifluus volemus]